MNTLETRILAAARWFKGGGDTAIFIALSLFFSLFIGQDQIVNRSGLTYCLLVTPAIVFPLLRLRQTLDSLVFGLARPFAVLGFLGCAWSIIGGDYSVIPPLVIIVWVSGWVLRSEAKVNLNLLLAVFLTFYTAGVVRFYTQPPINEVTWLNTKFAGEAQAFKAPPNSAQNTADAPPDTIPAPSPVAENEPARKPPPVFEPDQVRDGLNLNGWGILPGETAPTYGPWRISVTPNIAASGTISLFAMMLALSPLAWRGLKLVSIVVSGYFLFLSFVRSALIGFCLFCLAQVNLRALPSRSRFRMIFAALLVGGAVVITVLAPYALYFLQDIGPISRLLLRGQTHLTVDDIYRQLYRPWIWQQHMQLFLKSVFWMGQGSNLARDAASSILNVGQARSDSVSLPTRLLATYGLPALAFFWFIVERCYSHIKANDIWAVSATSAIVWLMMTWGSVFHPTNAIFALSILILGRGSSGFVSGVQTGMVKNRVVQLTSIGREGHTISITSRQNRNS
jgi:hypothetical protein